MCYIQASSALQAVPVRVQASHAAAGTADMMFHQATHR